MSDTDNRFGRVKLYQDRITEEGLVPVDNDSTENYRDQHKGSYSTKHDKVTASTQAAFNRVGIRRAAPVVAQSVPEGAPEAGTDTPAIASDAGVDSGIPSDPRGFSDDKGNFVSVQGDGSLLLSHTSGAHISIQADGAIFISASGNKGINLVSGKGGLNLRSKGTLTLGGENVIIASNKGMSFSTAAGSAMLFTAAGSMVMGVGESFEKKVGGSDTSFVGGSQGNYVFGDMFNQAQGRMQIGSASDIIMDSPRTNVGASDRLTLNSQGGLGMFSKSAMYVSSQATLGMQSKGSMILTSKQNLIAVGQEAINIESPKQTTMRGDIVNVESKSGMMLDSSEYLFARAKTLAASAATTLTVKAGTSLKLSSMGTLDIDAEGAINIAGATIDLNSRAKDPTEPDDAMVTTPKSASNPATVDVAEEGWDYEKDQWINKDQFEKMNNNYNPQKAGFPYNVDPMSEDQFDSFKNGGGQPPQEAQQVFDSKPTSGPAISDGAGYGEYPSNSSGSETVARESDVPPPDGTDDSSATPSLEGIPGYQQIPGDGQCDVGAEDIVNNLLHLKENILDPLIAENPDARAVKGFVLKYDNDCNNPHYKGLALDIAAGNKRDGARVAELANWAYDNLPCKLIKIERTKTYAYVHIEAAEAGQDGTKAIKQTCFDVEGKNCKEGFHILSFEKEVKPSKRLNRGSE